MKTIREIAGEPVGKRFRIECRATAGSVCRAGDGRYYIPIKLEDMSGGVTGYAVEGAYDGPSETTPSQLVSASLTIEQGESRPYIRITRLRPISDGAAAPARVLPASWCPVPELLDKLAQLVDSLGYFPLIRFLESFLDTDALTKPFLAVPASADCHHVCPGGLLMHSLDCARRVRGFLATDDRISQETAIVAALLHDIGKIRILTPDGQYQRTALLMDHRVLTNEILSPFLNELDSYDDDTANQLRYIWSWQPARGGDPLVNLVTAVQAADIYSAKKDAAERMFSTRPAWQQRVTFRGRGPARHFWRRREFSQFRVCTAKTDR